MVKVAQPPVDMGGDIHFVTYQVFSNESHCNKTVQRYRDNLTEVASYECERRCYADYLYCDTIRWGDHEYSVGTVEINIFNISDALNIVRRFTGNYDSKLFHYWRVEKPIWLEGLAVPSPVTTIKITELIQHAGLVCSALSSTEQWEFLVYLNSVSCQALLDSKICEKTWNDTACVDLSLMSRRFCSVWTSSTSRSLQDICSALQSTYIIPVFAEQFKWNPSSSVRLQVCNKECDLHNNLRLLPCEKIDGTRYYVIDIVN